MTVLSTLGSCYTKLTICGGCMGRNIVGHSATCHSSTSEIVYSTSLLIQTSIVWILDYPDPPA